MGDFIRSVVVVISLTVFPRAASADNDEVATRATKQRDAQAERAAERQAIFKAVSMSGSARILSQRVQQYRLDEHIECLHQICEAASLVPHRLGWFDALHVVSSILDDRPNYRNALNDALFGYTGTYEVTLWDFPRATLLKNLDLLSRLPEPENVSVVIYGGRKDDQLAKALDKLKVRYRLEQRDLSALATTGGRVAGVVIDQHGKPVEGATLYVVARDGKHLSHSVTTDKQGRFVVGEIPRISCSVRAVSPSPWLESSQPPFAFSKPVNADPGDDHVRLVLEVATVPDRSGSDR